MAVGTKTTVSVKNNDLEFALRRFKTQLAKTGNLSKVREKTEYIKPGVRRREEKKANTINSRKKNKNY